jgi:hypothetical protein
MPTASQHAADLRPSRKVIRTPEAPTVVSVVGTSRRGRRGRTPLLLDDRKRSLLLTAIKAGNRLSVAARFAGVSPKSVSEWMRRGEGRDGRPAIEPYTSFVRAVEHAQAESEVAAMAAIRKAMRRNPRWAVWWLETTVPEWRRSRDRGEATVPLPAPALEQSFVLIPGETLRRLATEQVRARLGEPDSEDATQIQGE